MLLEHTEQLGVGRCIKKQTWTKPFKKSNVIIFLFAIINFKYTQYYLST